MVSENGGVDDLEFWRALALYLADCHAATGETLGAKASKRAHRRMATICEQAYEAIRSGGCDAKLSDYWQGRRDDAVMDRLASVFVGAYDPSRR